MVKTDRFKVWDGTQWKVPAAVDVLQYVTDHIVFEAENAEQGSDFEPFQFGTDSNASNNEYIYVPDGNGKQLNSPPEGEGTATFTFNVDNSGDYLIWGRVIAPDGDHNSFWIDIDGTVYGWKTPTTSSWTWDEVNDHHGSGTDPVVHTLSTGEHTLHVKWREHGTKLDKLVLTKDTSYKPSGTGPVPSWTSTVVKYFDGSQWVKVFPFIAPTADFIYSPTSPAPDESITFDASESSDSDGSIQSYAWDFGDGNTATGETVTHSYSSTGDYTVQLTVTDDDGLTDSTNQTISVEDVATDGPLGTDGVYFTDIDGTPVWLTGWAVCCPGNHALGWPWINKDALDTLAAHNGNWVHIRLGPFVHDDNPQAYVETSTDGVFDLSQWNSTFFTNLRDIISYARDQGVYIEVDLIDAWILERGSNRSPWHKDHNINGVDAGDCSILQSAPQTIHKKYLKKVVREIGDLDNVIFQIGNETFDCNNNGVSLEWAEGVASTVENELQNQGYSNKIISTNSHTSSIEDSSKVDYVNIHQTGEISSPHSGKPTGNNEDNSSQTINETTDRLWRGFLNNTFFHYWVGGDDSTTRSEKLDRIEVFHNLINGSVDFANFDTRESDYAGQLGQEYVGYVTSGGTITIDLGSTEKTFDYRWIDPADGTIGDSGTVTDSGSHDFTAPTSERWILHVEAQ